MNDVKKQRWMKSVGITTGVFVVLSIYLYLRRGYYNTYIINKVLGSTAAILAGVTLLIGPLAHRYKSLALAMPLRRELGLLALATSLIHIFFSLFVLSDRFPISWYLQEITPITFGGIAVAIWLYVASISSNKSIKSLGSDAWRWRQKLGGHIAFIAIYLHLVIMKYPGWLRWLNGQVKQSPELANPSYPPASTFVFIIMTAIIIYRVVLVLRPKRT